MNSHQRGGMPRQRTGAHTYIGTVHPSRDPDFSTIPGTPSLVKVSWDPEGEWVFTPSAREVVERLADEGLSAEDEPIIWYRTGLDPASGSADSVSSLLVPASALRAGRPTRVVDVRNVPEAWGLYRIKRQDMSAYVGISSNLRIRLRTHMRSGVYRPGSGDIAEHMLAKLSDDERIVTWSALAEAERLHIARLRDRGYVMDNRTLGGNARSPSVPINT